MQLIQGTIGKNYEVEDITLPLEIERRLESIGLTYGTSVKILNKKKRGAIIVTIRGTRFAMGSNLAEHVEVEEVADHE